MALDVPIYIHPAEPPAAVREAYYTGFDPAVITMLPGPTQVEEVLCGDGPQVWSAAARHGPGGPDLRLAGSQRARRP